MFSAADLLNSIWRFVNPKPRFQLKEIISRTPAELARFCNGYMPSALTHAKQAVQNLNKPAWAALFGTALSRTNGFDPSTVLNALYKPDWNIVVPGSAGHALHGPKAWDLRARRRLRCKPDTATLTGRIGGEPPSGNAVYRPPPWRFVQGKRLPPQSTLLLRNADYNSICVCPS